MGEQFAARESIYHIYDGQAENGNFGIDNNPFIDVPKLALGSYKCKSNFTFEAALMSKGRSIKEGTPDDC
jgi:hypothetical protein